MLRTISAFDRIGEENAFAVLARANALVAQGKDIINLGIGQPDFRTPEFIVEAAIKALRDGHHGYTPANGIPPLREAVAADLHKRFKVEVSPETVMILPGGKPTMFMAILMFGEPGVDILYPDPGFPIYRSMIEFTGARPVPVPIREANGFAFSAEETLSLLTPATRLLILNSPANPTGGVPPEGGDRPPRGGPRPLSRRGDSFGRDLQSHDLRRRGARLALGLPGDSRPPDPSRRRVQNLRHDGLAARLVGVAGPTLRGCPQARGELLFVRQCGDPMGRDRGAHWPAGRREGHDGGLRPPPPARNRGPEPAAGRVLRDPEGRVLR